MRALVSLRNCYGWDCPDCGYKNVIEQFVKELQEPDESGMGLYEVGPVHSGVVFCERCESFFPVEQTPQLNEFDES